MLGLDALNSLLLNQLPTYGYLALAGGAFIGALGLPLPMTFVLLTAGILTDKGGLAFPFAAVTVLVAAVAGDCGGFAIGHVLGRRLVRRWGERIGLTAPRLARVEQVMRRWGGWLVWWSRWLLTPMAVPLNFLAGANGYSFPRFLLYDAAGEAIWALAYLGLGRLFGKSAAGPAGTIGKIVTAALAVALIFGGGYFARRLFQQRRRVPSAPSGALS